MNTKKKKKKKKSASLQGVADLAVVTQLSLLYNLTSPNVESSLNYPFVPGADGLVARGQ